MDGDPDPKDDPSIPDEELLYRGVHRIHLKPGPALSSGTFISRTNPHPSVDRASLSTPEETHQRRPTDVGVVKLVTGFVRSLTPGVASDPIGGNPAHALIIHDRSLSRSQWKEVALSLARSSAWAIPPPDDLPT